MCEGNQTEEFRMKQNHLMEETSQSIEKFKGSDQTED
jgi:hypothetical protein